MISNVDEEKRSQLSDSLLSKNDPDEQKELDDADNDSGEQNKLTDAVKKGQGAIERFLEKNENLEPEKIKCWLKDGYLEVSQLAQVIYAVEKQIKSSVDQSYERSLQCIDIAEYHVKKRHPLNETPLWKISNLFRWLSSNFKCKEEVNDKTENEKKEKKEEKEIKFKCMNRIIS